MIFDSNRWQSIAIGSIRLLLIAIAFTTHAEIETAAEWAESDPPIRFESRDWAEAVLAGATNSQSIAIEGGRLQSNTTWTSDKTHLVFNTVYVPSGITLTITEGAVVKYCPGTTIKVEDGGKLVVNGADGNDAILTAANDATVGEAIEGFSEEQSISFEGIRLQSSAASFSDNGCLETRGFSYGAFPNITVNSTEAVRNGGVAYVPFTLSGNSRDAVFSVDWVAVEGTAKFGDDYTLASGRIVWNKSNEGTKTLAIPLNAGNISGEERVFTVRIAAAHCANIARREGTVKIVEREGLTLEWAEEWAESSPPIRFESRDWAEAVLAGATNNEAIAVEGGRLQSNTTWTSNKTHLVFNTVYVPSGVTLTITEGAVVKYCPGTTIKVEDGGKLNIVGADGNDAILTAANDATVGEAIEGFDAEQSIAFDGIRLQSSAAQFTDNCWLQTRGFNYGNFPSIYLNDTMAFRSSGVASIPVTLGGATRDKSFNVDWEAVDGTAKFGEDYTLASGRISWNKSSEGTKTLSIPLVADHIVGSNTAFRLKLVVSRGSNIARGECTVTIKELDSIAFGCGMAESDPPIRFESRDWAEAVLAGATNNEAIAVEGGRLQSNTTWASDKTHLVFNTVYVPSGVTLTITEGAVVKYCPGTTIKVEDGGKLVVNGADGNDAILTAANDATVGAAIEGFDAEQSIAFEGIRLQSSAASFSDNGWLQTRGFSFGSYPTLTLYEATANRNNGTVYLPITVSGSTRNQSFTVDWAVEDGTAQFGRDFAFAGGRLTWSKSGDGTKYIAIPLLKDEVAGTNREFLVRLVTARGCNVARSTVVATIAEYENGGITDLEVVESEASEPSPEFSIVEGIKTQPLFLNPVETVQYSGKWQTYDANEAAVLRVTLETDNGVTLLKEVSPTETGSFDLDLAKYPVGCYTLKHDILDEFGETLATMQKTFSIADEEDVVMHGGTLTQNEVWEAGKVHVVYQTVVVPSIYTIFIEPGAIVKFMTGTGIDISQGGAFFANGIVFTHINDDTVGGDTLNDGFTVSPPMDAYFLSGAFTFGDDTELRGITQNTALAGTISTQKTLSRGSTYRVSGTVTIASGASLTIPPGTVLKMEAGAAIVVNSGATLNAIGTRAAPIVITSIKDDSVSGDTNGDGDATIPQPGDWVKIGVNGGTANFEFVSILYSSKNQTTGAINQNGGVVRFVNSEIAHGMYDAVGVESGNFYMTNSVIRDCLLAFRHWAKDPIVNSVIFDCGRLTQGGGQIFVNCIFSNIAETWEAFGFPKSTYCNCCFWNEGGSVLTAEGEQDALTVCGKDGNIWGDPLFIDPVNGDFRIREGSPCVDAADDAVAPELDYYGQPRITVTDMSAMTNLVGQLADIGICEVMPRDVVSDIDLVPQSVRTTTNAVPGQLLFVKWEIANVGGAEVNAAWRDTVSLVSENGREVVLGNKTTTSRIAVGGSVFCSGYFTVPAISEGTWYPKVNVNSYHDIFEGALAANNALVGERAVSVGLVAFDPGVSREGVINAGTPTVLKFAFDEDDANRMVSFDVPAGVKVSWGFGFMPQGVSRSGAMTASGDGVMFKVPEGATEVYVILESDKTATYALSTDSIPMLVTGVSPATLPSSGTTTLTITGAGFGDDCEVVLSTAAVSCRAQSIAKDAAGNLVATVDCASLISGHTYDVAVLSGGIEATYPNAVNVIKAEGKGVLDLEYSIPPSVRPGRVFTFTVTYRNIGNKDMCCPLIAVADTGNDAVNPIQFSLDGERFTPGGFQFVGTDSTGGFDALHPGDEVTLHVQAKIPSANNGSTAISVRANTESDIMAKYTTEIDRYLTPSMKAEFAATSDEELKARGERLAQVLGANNGEMVQNFAALAKRFYECNGFVLQKVDDLTSYGVAVVKADGALNVAQDARVNSQILVAGKLATSSTQELADQARRELCLSATTGAYVRRVDGGYAHLEDSDVDLAGKSVLIIAHGLNDGISKSSWMRDIGNALASQFDVVVYVDWSAESFANFWDGVADYAFFWNWNNLATASSSVATLAYDKYQQLINVSGHIGAVANLVYDQLTGKNFNAPDKCVCIGHSFGAHLTGRISHMMGSDKWHRAKRHIGLDTAAISAVPNNYVVSGNDAQITEYYRSSSGSGRNDAYADYNYIVANRNSFEFNVSHSAAAFTDDHSYSHDWLIFNIRHGQSSGVGYWSQHGLPAPNGSCLAMSTSGFIGVIDGSRDVLECTYKFGEAGFRYPGNNDGWRTTYFAWKQSADLDIVENGSVSLRDNAELTIGVPQHITVTIADNCDIQTVERWSKYRLRIAYRDEAGNSTPVLTKVQQEKTFSFDFKFPNWLLKQQRQNGALVFTVDHETGDETSWGTLFDHELYPSDNMLEVAVTIANSDLPVACINGESLDDFTIDQQIPYSSYEEYVKAAEGGKTFTFTFDGSKSIGGGNKKVTQYIWRNPDTEKALGTKSTLSMTYSATADDRYPISLVIANENGEIDTVKGWLHVIPVDKRDGQPIEQPRSVDPNEMRGKLGFGNPETERFVRPGEELTYTIYFENMTNATAAAQEVYVTNPLSEWLDWSTFKMCEVAFGDQIDLGLVDKQAGASEATMKGTNFVVRTTLGGGYDGDGVVAELGVVQWYLRIVDPTTDTGWPKDIRSGFLPPNDPETGCGEGHITYTVKVREDAPYGVIITNSASIVFDTNDPIETDPAWWNTVGRQDWIDVETSLVGAAKGTVTSKTDAKTGVVTLTAKAGNKSSLFAYWEGPEGEKAGFATTLKLNPKTQGGKYTAVFTTKTACAAPSLDKANAFAKGGATMFNSVVGVAASDRFVVPDACYPVKFAVKGMPKGLKVNATSGAITGIPTKAGKYTATVTVTSVANAKKKVTVKVPITIAKLPKWTYGTFTGLASPNDARGLFENGSSDENDVVGSAKMTIAATGKMTLNVLVCGTNWTASASGFAATSDRGNERYDVKFTAKAKIGKKTLSRSFALTLDRQSCYDDANGGATVALDTAFYDSPVFIGTGLYMKRYMWKDSGAAAWLAPYTGAYMYYTADNEKLTLTVAANGVVKVAGTLANGRKLSLSTYVVLAGDGWDIPCALVYAPATTAKVKVGKTTRTVKYGEFFEQVMLDNHYSPPEPGYGTAYRNAGLKPSAEGSGTGTFAYSPAYGQAGSNKVVTVTAKPAKNSVFAYWTRNGEIVSYSPTYKVTMLGGDDTSLKAEFRLKSDFGAVDLAPWWEDADGNELEKTEIAEILKWRLFTGLKTTLRFRVSDDVRPVKFTATGLPKGMSLNATTGVLSGIPTSASSGTIKITVASTANTKKKVTQSFKWQVRKLRKFAQGTFKGEVSVNYISDDRDENGYRYLITNSVEKTWTVTVGANGKASGKVTENGKTYVLSTPCYSSYQDASTYTEGLKTYEDETFTAKGTVSCGGSKWPATLVVRETGDMNPVATKATRATDVNPKGYGAWTLDTLMTIEADLNNIGLSSEIKRIK